VHATLSQPLSREPRAQPMPRPPLPTPETEAREAPMNDTDMSCDVTFDLAVGWPKG